MTKLTFVVDLSVPVDVCFPDHLVYFLVCQLLSQVSHHMTQLCCTDVAISILTKRWGKVIRPTCMPFQCFSAYLLWICEAGGQIKKKDHVLLFTTSSNEEHAGLVRTHLQWGAVASYQKCCYEKGILFWKLTGHFLHSYFWLPALNITWGESVSPHRLTSSHLNRKSIKTYTICLVSSDWKLLGKAA